MLLFSHSAVSNSLWPHGQQHIRLPCPSLSPVIYSHSCSLSWWCHPIISSSVTTFFSCPQSFSALGAFPKSWLLASGGQNTRASSFSLSPSNEYSRLTFVMIDWFDFLAVQGTLKSLIQHHSSKASIVWCSCALLWSSIPKIRLEETNHYSHRNAVCW